MAETTYTESQSRTGRLISSGASFIEALGGIAVVTLAIIGLSAHKYAIDLGGVNAIIVGAALLFETGSIAARYAAMPETPGTAKYSMPMVGGSGVIVGIGGIVLGILSLAKVAPTYLIPISIIAFGFAYLVNFVSHTRLYALEADAFGLRTERAELFRDTSISSHGAQWMVGVAAIALGIIGLARVHPLVLSLVAFLGLGGAFIIAGSVVGARMITATRTPVQEERYQRPPRTPV